MIAQVQIEGALSSSSKAKIPSPFADEWLHYFPGSSNLQFVNAHAFRDQYSFYRNVEVSDRNGNELFWVFHNNRNPCIRNWGKLIFLEVFVDVDLLKALIKSYNLVSHAFHKKG